MADAEQFTSPLEWAQSWGPDEEGDESHSASTPFGATVWSAVKGAGIGAIASTSTTTRIWIPPVEGAAEPAAPW